jgi:hypothetical protein
MNHPYASLAYAQAFGAGYEPIYLPGMDLHVLKRPIAGTPYFDAMGPYPLSPVTSVDRAGDDFAVLSANQVVSLVLVIDPMRAPPVEAMAKAFDQVTYFKDHFVREPGLDRPYSEHHRAKVRRAYRACETRIVRLTDHLEEWSSLYAALSLKHQISGIQAFDRQYFADLAKLEPLMVAAFIEGALVSAHIWIRDKDHAYAHLAASSPEGYRQSAAYAVYDHSFRYLADQGVRLVNLGGGAGTAAPSQGLTYLKQGFSTGTLQCYLCGQIIEAEIYNMLSKGCRAEFFPAYRSGIRFVGG